MVIVTAVFLLQTRQHHPIRVTDADIHYGSDLRRAQNQQAGPEGIRQYPPPLPVSLPVVKVGAQLGAQARVGHAPLRVDVFQDLVDHGAGGSAAQPGLDDGRVPAPRLPFQAGVFVLEVEEDQGDARADGIVPHALVEPADA